MINTAPSPPPVSPQRKPLLQALLHELGLGAPAQTNATPPIVPQQNATPLPPPQPTPGLTPPPANRPVLGATLPQTQAPGTNQVATVPPPAVQARERKNTKTDAKRRQGTQLRQATKAVPPPNATPPPASSIQQPPQEKSPRFNAAQYQAPKNDALRYIATGIALLFGGSRAGSAATGFLVGQNQKAKDTYTRQEQAAEQQYQVAKDQAAVNYTNAKAVWDNNADVRARGINPLNGKPFQYPTMQQAGGKGDFTSDLAALDRLQQLAARNGDTAAQQRYASDQTVLITQQKDAENWQKFIITQQDEDRRAANTQAGEDARESAREDRADARALLGQNKPLTPMEKIDLTAKADASTRQFRTDYASLTQPKAGAFGVQSTPAIRGPLVGRLNGLFSMIRQSQDPQGLASHLSSLTKDTNAQQLIQEYGDSMALQRQSQGQPVIPQSYANVPESDDTKLNALYQKAISHGLNVDDPTVLKAILHDAGITPTDTGGSQASIPFPG